MESKVAAINKVREMRQQIKQQGLQYLSGHGGFYLENAQLLQRCHIRSQLLIVIAVVAYEPLVARSPQFQRAKKNTYGNP